MPNEQLATAPSPEPVELADTHSAAAHVIEFPVERTRPPVPEAYIPDRREIPLQNPGEAVKFAHDYSREHPGWHSAGVIDGSDGYSVVFERTSRTQ